MDRLIPVKLLSVALLALAITAPGCGRGDGARGRCQLP